MQYVGETTVFLNLRMNNHRKSIRNKNNTGCPHVIDHFTTCCKGESFSIQIIENLAGDGYNDFNEIDEVTKKIRLDKEDHWIKTLRTVYPYGLNEKSKNHNSIHGHSSSVGKLFPPLPRYGTKLRRTRGIRNNKNPNINSKTFFEQISTIIHDDIKNSMYKIRILLDQIKKGTLKEIASILLLKTPDVNLNIKYDQWYSFISDIINTKLYKHTKQPNKVKKGPINLCTVSYENKGIEDIHLSKILHENEVVQLLPNTLQSQENIPVIVYKLTLPLEIKSSIIKTQLTPYI